MDGNRRVISKGFIATKDSKIVSIGSGPPPGLTADQTVDASKKIVLPGFVCAHNHMYGVLSHGMPLKNAPSNFRDFLYDFWWPYVEDKLDKKQIQAAALHACVEMAKSGTTCFSDILEAPNSIPGALDAEATVVRKVGLRGILSFEASERVSSTNATASVKENVDFIKKWNCRNDIVKGRLCTHTLFTCSLEFLSYVKKLADELRSGIHIHLEEGSYETEFCLKRYGELPTEVYDRIGYLAPNLLASQCVHTRPEEIALFQRRGVKLAHMPLSNCEVGGGIAPIKQFLDAGLTVGLGTDGYVTDMFEVMRSAFLIHKGHLQDASVMPAQTVLEMATINGAQALGLADEIGSLEVGKQADFLVLDPKLPTPVTTENVGPQLVTFGRGSFVQHVFVDGTQIVKDGKLVTANEEEAKLGCRKAAQSLWDQLPK
jgi:cytosine/adenosine deaminase-related metal-dependent hydrolase